MSSSVARYLHPALGDTAHSIHHDADHCGREGRSQGAAHNHQHPLDHRNTPNLSPRLSADSDETLLALVGNGDNEALALLFHRNARIVRGVAYRVLRDMSEADDLLQDIFLLIRRLSGAFDHTRSSARFWILQMTYRRAISRRRFLTSRHFYTHLDLDQAANRMSNSQDGSWGPESSMNEMLDRGEALQSCFAGLSESQRQTLHLFFFEGFTFEEIAAKLGQTVGNARNHYYRGLEKLRKRISAGKLPGKAAV
jgi:RNA polymerase sigma-70 factor, ECF subfamily